MKLWLVRIECEGLVLAEDESSARDFAREIFEDRCNDDVGVDQVQGLPRGWTHDALVYRKGPDTTCAEALEIVSAPEPDPRQIGLELAP